MRDREVERRQEGLVSHAHTHKMKFGKSEGAGHVTSARPGNTITKSLPITQPG